MLIFYVPIIVLSALIITEPCLMVGIYIIVVYFPMLQLLSINSFEVRTINANDDYYFIVAQPANFLQSPETFFY